MRKRISFILLILLFVAGDIAGQWNLGERGINAEAAWSNFNVDGNGVKIAIISSGINIDLPEIAGRCLGSHSVIGGDTTDNVGWGTMMASAILADGPNVKGIAPKAQYYNIKITNDGSISWLDLSAAYEWALLKTDANIIYTNIWIGGDFWIEPMLDSNYAAGRLFVGQSRLFLGYETYPAHYGAVIGVGGYEDTVPPMLLSLNGNDVEVVGPGKAVPVINKDGDKTTDEGARIAAAQVAGALALMIDYNRTHEKGYSNSAIWETLNQSAIDLWQGDPKAGYGKTDVNAALAWMANNWFLEYKVNYLNPITYDISGMPIYFKGAPIQYSITVTNNSNQTSNPKEINDVNVVSQQTIPNAPEFFTVITLQSGETVTVGPYTFNIPTEIPTGEYNTEIILKRQRNIPQDSWLPPFSYEAIIKNDSIAGTYKIIDIVNFDDFAVFASWWLLPCDEGNLWCDGMDLIRNGVIDFEDLKEFVSYWLCQYP